MTNDELEAIELGDSLAEPPPWTYDESDMAYRESGVVRSSIPDLAADPVYCKGRIICKFFLRQGDQRKRDIQNVFFICNARLNVRTLCAAVRNAQARIEELESERDRMHKDLIAVEKNYDQIMNRLGEQAPPSRHGRVYPE